MRLKYLATKEQNAWEIFAERVRNNFHFSVFLNPSKESLKKRIAEIPGLLSC